MHKNAPYIFFGLILFVILIFVFLNVHRGRTYSAQQLPDCGPTALCLHPPTINVAVENYGFPAVSLQTVDQIDSTSSSTFGKYIEVAKEDGSVLNNIKSDGVAINILAALMSSVLSSFLMAVIKRTVFRAHYRY